ncbi:hypothetical protein NUW58_g6719 [Xylaria curta]|uniref:Uncharacterized protein n=1 Tax=Xylaria curta TaxID=42375 RepID=A0ACC1NPQ8_9PEZI|nr:hypothetical protein NUW58_g6719 [Xylaria curta]
MVEHHPVHNSEVFLLGRAPRPSVPPPSPPSPLTPTDAGSSTPIDHLCLDGALLPVDAEETSSIVRRRVAGAIHVLNTMESVREGNAQLRLADKITSNRMLRTRAEQHVNLAKLAEECEELRRESEAYGDTWRELERREGMDSDAEDGEAAPSKGITSGNATPHPEHSAILLNKGEAGSATPRPDSSRDERTPRPDSPGAAAVGA